MVPGAHMSLLPNSVSTGPVLFVELASVLNTQEHKQTTKYATCVATGDTYAMPMAGPITSLLSAAYNKVPQRSRLCLEVPGEPAVQRLQCGCLERPSAELCNHHLSSHPQAMVVAAWTAKFSPHYNKYHQNNIND